MECRLGRRTTSSTTLKRVKENMRKRTTSLIVSILGAAVLCLPMALGSPEVSSIASNDLDTIELGGRIFQKNCSPCHGSGAVGESPASPMGGWASGKGELAPALNGTGHAWHHEPAYFFRTIRNGSTAKYQMGNTVINSKMKGWAGRMSDYEMLAVIAYFQSLWPAHIKEGYRQRFLYRVWP